MMRQNHELILYAFIAVGAGSSEGESVVDSDDEGDDSEEYSELDEDEEEGLSWDELEEEAKR